MTIAIALSQLFRCLHPPAGGADPLDVITKAKLNFVLSPVSLVSLVLVILGIIFHRIFNKKTTYPVHWI